MLHSPNELQPQKQALPSSTRRPIRHSAFVIRHFSAGGRVKTFHSTADGEHTSLKHARIEGAIESAIRAAKEIHERPAGVSKAGKEAS